VIWANEGKQPASLHNLHPSWWAQVEGVKFGANTHDVENFNRFRPDTWMNFGHTNCFAFSSLHCPNSPQVTIRPSPSPPPHPPPSCLVPPPPPAPPPAPPPRLVSIWYTIFTSPSGRFDSSKRPKRISEDGYSKLPALRSSCRV